MSGRRRGTYRAARAGLLLALALPTTGRSAPSEQAISLGYRYVHISNLSLLGSGNPGLTFHTAVAAFDW